MSVWIDCINCGKQVIWEAGDDKCIWCGKSARVKDPGVVLLAPVKITKEVAVEVQGEERNIMSNKGHAHERHRFIEEHKAEIIADYWAMTSGEFKTKWDLSSSGWSTIRKRWAADVELAKPAEFPKKRKGNSVSNSRPKVGKTTPQPNYEMLQAEYDGYRKAILDVFGVKVPSSSKTGGIDAG